MTFESSKIVGFIDGVWAKLVLGNAQINCFLNTNDNVFIFNFKYISQSS